ncbi:helix-turn-helix transcriptional regulator [Nocardia sp. AG03]|uniref:helix-turn-helix domain-containing protein n=1 Tax=Nocardia sp. AG03 TaxID=3025312 RepID=UPI0024189FD1|nr:helix-turn-helix transcriptional regulator [Nocardia sp. AG03]
MSSRGAQGNDSSAAGARLRKLREEAGLSLTALATRVPYSRAALGHYETGTRAASPAVIAWYERIHAQAVLGTRRHDPRAADTAIATALSPGREEPLIEIGHPHPDESGYSCPFRVDGLIEGEAAGTDPATALHSALQTIGLELARAGRRRQRSAATTVVRDSVSRAR